MRCGIALGSNLGDRLAHLRQACSAVAGMHCAPQPPLVSPVYETEPVDCEPGDASYLNAVMEIEVTEPPLALLDALRQIEGTLGRPGPDRRLRNAPRTIDLDLLYAGDLTLATAELTLPHPRLFSRRFVLQPLADLRPGLILPGRCETIAHSLSRLPLTPAVRILSDALVIPPPTSSIEP